MDDYDDDDDYTPMPSPSPVPPAAQAFTMTLLLLVGGLFIVCACCMTKEDWCCHKCLLDWCCCRVCGNCLGGRCKAKNGDFLIRTFGWLRPVSICGVGAAPSELYLMQFQLGLLLWKRFTEIGRNTSSTVFFFLLPTIGLVVMLLLYASFASPAFSNSHSSGVIEVFASPMLFIVAVQLTATSLVAEKAQRLTESMRMMGMREAPYWASYFLADGVAMGFLLSFTIAALSAVMGLYHNLGAGYGNSDQQQDFFGLLILLFLSTLAMTSMAFAISACFDTPQTAAMCAFAAMIAGVVIFALFLFTPSIKNALFDSAAQELLWCLFPPTGLQVGLLAGGFTMDGGLFQYFKADVELSSVYGMLLLDSAAYSFLSWYLAQVMPSSIGVQRPVWFLLDPAYWREGCGGGKSSSSSKNNQGTNGGVLEGSTLTSPLTGAYAEQAAPSSEADFVTCPYEPAVPTAGAASAGGVAGGQGGGPSVSVRGLSKTFGGSPVDGSGGFVAVDDLSFDMHEGQITSLLGHNGAGKTTTINMLTGLFPPDARSRSSHHHHSSSSSSSSRRPLGQTTIYGEDIVSNMAGARRVLGVCPQHDVLFDRLTAREHVAFFSLLKSGGLGGGDGDNDDGGGEQQSNQDPNNGGGGGGVVVSWAAANREADALLAHFHLSERAAHVGSELSGGMKRKLSTAVALCGGSKFVVLDEPTAGMDPLARRELWDLLKALRKGRTMLLTTHYMDEADVLGDRIGIMSRGQLQCLGSSTFLKHHFGAGYKLICTMQTGAIMGEVADNGGNGGGADGGQQFENVRREALETHPKTLAILDFIRKSVPAGYPSAKQPVSTRGNRAESTDLLAGPMYDAYQNAQVATTVSGGLEVATTVGDGPLSLAQFVPLESSAASLAFVLPFDAVRCFGHFFSALDARLHALSIAGYGVTITSLEEVFLKVGGDHDLEAEAASASSTPQKGGANEYSVVANGGGNDQGGGGGGDDAWMSVQVYGLWMKRLRYGMNDLRKAVPMLLLPIGATTAAFTLNATGVMFRPGGSNSNILTALICAGGYIPVVALVVEHVVSERVSKLRNVLTVMGCDLKSYWLGTLLGDMTLFGVCIASSLIVVAICASFPVTDINTRDDDFNDQIVDDRFGFSNSHGPKPGTGKVSHLGSDWEHPLLPYINDGRLVVLLLLLGLQLCSFSYFTSFWFASPKLAIAFMPFFCIVLILAPAAFTGMGFYCLGRKGFMIINPTGNDILRGMLWFITVTSPHGAFCMGMLRLGDVCHAHESDCIVPPFWAVSMIMAVESCLYLLATYRIDRRNFLPVAPQALPAQTAAERAAADAALDEDVRGERDVVVGMAPDEVAPWGSGLELGGTHTDLHSALEAGGGAHTHHSRAAAYSLRMANLRKLFPPKKPSDPPLAAVKDLCLRIPRGEVFGLLGANGAGKTTAISMIMRSLYPNAGDIHIEGHSVLSQFKAAAKHLGVVTQHNTLWDRLSCLDHLRLFARLRGVSHGDIEALVHATVAQMELGPYKHKLAMQLSGGMKRKLCVAIALIGDPKLVLLDEPSAGLDPVSRRNLWDTLIKTMQSRAVVLTTHSMEEAEALCTRIGIMVKGQLRALGTPQHLKQKYGSGYEIIIKLDPTAGSGDGSTGSEEQHAERVIGFITEVFPSAGVLSDNGGLLTMRVPPDSMNVGAAFAALETNKAALGIADYAVAQPTLEQVFVRTVLEHSGGERPNATANHPDADIFSRASLGDGVRSHQNLAELGAGGAAAPALARSRSSSSAADSSSLSTPQPASGQVGGLQVHDPMSLDTGVATKWCGLDRRSHKFMAISCGLTAYICYNTVLRGGVGYAFLPFLVTFVASVVGCAGCCCCIPSAGEEEDKD